MQTSKHVISNERRAFAEKRRMRLLNKAGELLRVSAPAGDRRQIYVRLHTITGAIKRWEKILRGELP